MSQWIDSNTFVDNNNEQWVGVTSQSSVGLLSSIKGVALSYSDLNSHINSVFINEDRSLIASIATHIPLNIRSSIKGIATLTTNLKTSVTASWFKDTAALSSYIGIHTPINIEANITGEPTVNLPAHIRSFHHRNMLASIHSWQELQLTSYIATHTAQYLYSSIRPWYTESVSNLNSFLAPLLKTGDTSLYNSIAAHAPDNIKSSISMHQPINIGSLIAAHVPAHISGSIRGFDFKNLDAYIAMHDPHNLGSYIFAYRHRQLSAVISGWQEYYLSSTIDNHLPIRLDAYIFAYQYRGVTSSIYGWQELQLGSDIDNHLPIDFQMYANLFQRNTKDLGNSLHGWQILELNAVVAGIMFYSELNSYILSVGPIDLSAYIKSWPSGNLTMSMRVWAPQDLTGYLYTIYAKDIQSAINIHLPINLTSRIKGIDFQTADLSLFVHCMRYMGLGASISSFNKADFTAYLFAIAHYNLRGFVHSFDHRLLGATINASIYPYNITASITGIGAINNIHASINPVQALAVYRHIGASLEGYSTSILTVAIYAIGAVGLTASIMSTMGTLSLSAYIKPDMVRMTKMISVSTMEMCSLTAMINVSCFGSGYKELDAYIGVVYLANLNCILNGKEYTKEYSSLNANIGYDYKYIVTDIININVATFGDRIVVIDNILVAIRVYSAITLLYSSIIGVPIEKNLSATIMGTYVEDYHFKYANSKVKVYDINKYTNIAQLSKIVEMTFKESVPEHIYLSEGNETFTESSLDTWLTKLQAFIPANKTLNLKRRLFRSININHLGAYNTLDNLIKATIVYLTEEPSGNLTADLNMSGGSMSFNLLAHMQIRSSHNTYGNLSTSITPIVPKVWIKHNDTIQNI